MNRRLVAAMSATSALACSLGAYGAPPPNDLCVNAITVVDGDNAIDSRNATQDTVITCFPQAYIDEAGNEVLSGDDVWYSYTPTETGLRNFEITSGFDDSTLAIYDSCGGASLACNYAGGYATRAKIYHFPVTAGVTYKIRFALLFGGGSTTTLNISAPRTPVTLDDCALAMPFAGQGDVPVNTAGLVDSDVQAWDCNIPHDGWIAWTPSLSGRAVINACDTSGILLALYAACGEAPVVGCTSAFRDPPAPNTCLNRMAYNVTAGQTYYVRFGSVNPVSGNIHFEVRPLSTAFHVPLGALAEPGNCTDAPSADLNGGCNVGPNAVTALNLCDTYVGTVNGRELPLDTLQDPVTYSADTDWYEFTLANDDTITYSGQSEFTLALGDSVGGIYTNDCPPIRIRTLPNVGGNTVDGVYSFSKSEALPAGTYRFVMGPLTGGGGNAGDCAHGSNRYWFTLSGSIACTGACCNGSTCTVTTQAACTGSYKGSHSVCTASTCCIADFDGNASVAVSDIFAFLRAWFAHSPSADVDGVSGVSVSDIFYFLRHWFARC